MIKLMRVDDRLIHGQCMTVLVKMHQIKQIIVVDNYTAQNKLLRSIFQSAVPKGMKAVPVTVEDAIPMVQEAVTNDVNTLVLARVPSVMLELFKNTDAPKELNIASVQATGADRYITNDQHVTQAEIDAVKEMGNMGVHVWFNLVPGKTAVTEWDSIKAKF